MSRCPKCDGVGHVLHATGSEDDGWYECPTCNPHPSPSRVLVSRGPAPLTPEGFDSAGAAGNLSRLYSQRADADPSIADRQWLSRNIAEALDRAWEAGYKHHRREVELVEQAMKDCTPFPTPAMMAKGMPSRTAAAPSSPEGNDALVLVMLHGRPLVIVQTVAQKGERLGLALHHVDALLDWYATAYAFDRRELSAERMDSVRYATVLDHALKGSDQSGAAAPSSPEGKATWLDDDGKVHRVSCEGGIGKQRVPFITDAIAATPEGNDAMTSLRALHAEACALMDHSTGGSRSHAFFQRAAVTLAVFIEAMTQAGRAPAPQATSEAVAAIHDGANAPSLPEGIGALDRLAAIIDGDAFDGPGNELTVERAERRNAAREKVRLIENALVAAGWQTIARPTQATNEAPVRP